MKLQCGDVHLFLKRSEDALETYPSATVTFKEGFVFFELEGGAVDVYPASAIEHIEIEEASDGA